MNKEAIRAALASSSDAAKIRSSLPDIEELKAEGHSYRAIHRAMLEQGEISCVFSNFYRVVRSTQRRSPVKAASRTIAQAASATKPATNLVEPASAPEIRETSKLGKEPVSCLKNIDRAALKAQADAIFAANNGEGA